MVRNPAFRGGDYHKYVTVGKRTVKEGECCAIWDDEGKQSLILGPRRVWVWKSTVKFLDRHFADQQQYLVINHKDGRREHVRGPKAVFEDPVLHNGITVHPGLHVNNYEVIIVYREEAEDKVVRRLIRGPLLFIPDSNEWVHSFSWHGPDPENKVRIKADAWKFQKLQTIPDQIYYNVTDVRTTDDAQITVKLMVFYEIVDIEKMLDSTHDPIADLINAVCADVIQKCSVMSYTDFIQSTADFNSLSTYAGLLRMAETIGFKIPNVVYRGYQASDKLQTMHDAAIQSRTKLNNEAEVAEQLEKLEDMKLTKKLERSMREMQMEQSAKEHQLRMSALEHKEALLRNELEHKEQMRQREAETIAVEESQKRKNEEQLRFLTQLSGLQVDLTKLLVAQNLHYDKTIKIDTGVAGAGGEAAGEGAEARPPNVVLNFAAGRD